MRNLTNILVGTAVIALAGIAIYFNFYSVSNQTMFPYQDSNAVAEGKKIYLAECASCHGVNLEGEANWKSRDAEGYLPAPPHDQTGHTWHHDEALLFKLTKHGIQAIAGADYKSRMPAFKDKLSDEQILRVLAYIKSTWPAEVASQHTEMSKNK